MNKFLHLNSFLSVSPLFCILVLPSTSSLSHHISQARHFDNRLFAGELKLQNKKRQVSTVHILYVLLNTAECGGVF